MEKIPELPPNRKPHTKQIEPEVAPEALEPGSVIYTAPTKKLPWKTIIVGLAALAFLAYKFMPKLPEGIKAEVTQEAPKPPVTIPNELPPVRIVSSDTAKLARLEAKLAELEEANAAFQGALEESARRADVADQNIKYLKRTVSERDAKIALLGNKLGRAVRLHMENQVNLGQLAQRIKSGEKTFTMEVVKRKKHEEAEWENDLE